jgi:hypothetical protein
MTPDFQRIFQSKRSYRQRLAERPIAEKLQMLDVMRERALLIRPAREHAQSAILREDPPNADKH